MDRRTFLVAAAASLVAQRATAQADALHELSVDELQQRMAAGALSARTLTEACLERIRKHDGAIKSVLETNPDAVAIATALDAERKRGKTRGPLHGMPVLLKDNIETKDKMMCTAGSLALRDAPPKRDAVVVEKLRAAGCIILGKTNMSEWANIRGERSVSGWSARGGFTRNPYALDRTPCGSSSGSGAAVAAGFAPLAVGSETWGSIQCPSATNGVVGIKPSLGIISQTGIIPISHSFDTAGPMTRSVRDAALLLHAMGGPAPSAPAVAGRVGVARNSWGRDERLRGILEKHLAVLKEMGAQIVDIEIEDGSTYAPAAIDIFMFELKADMAAYLKARGAKEKTIDDLIAFNKAHAGEELAIFGQEHFEDAARRGDLSTKEYRLALRKIEIAQKEVAEIFAKNSLDAYFGPTLGVPWLIDPVRGDTFDEVGTALPTLAGGPIVTVVGGYVSGLPLGVNFEGVRGSDTKVIAMAQAFEERLKLRRPPQFLATAPL